jgi:hypothetical protein
MILFKFEICSIFGFFSKFVQILNLFIFQFVQVMIFFWFQNLFIYDNKYCSNFQFIRISNMYRFRICSYYKFCSDFEFIQDFEFVQMSNLCKILNLFQFRICSNLNRFWFFQIFVLFKYQILFRFENGLDLEKFGLWEVRETVFFRECTWNSRDSGYRRIPNVSDLLDLNCNGPGGASDSCC